MNNPTHYYIIYDWETGGLDAKKHACVELAMIAVRADNFKEVDRISTMIAPYCDLQYTEKALEINKTSFEDIISGNDAKQVVKAIIQLGEKCKVNNRDGKAILVAHNADFDRNFTQQIFEVTGKSKDMPKIFAGSIDYYGNFQPHCIDTIDLARLKWHKNDNEIANYKLGTCMSKLGIDLIGAHKAINDTLGLKDMFLELKKCIRSDSGETVNESRFRDTKIFEY